MIAPLCGYASTPVYGVGFYTRLIRGLCDGDCPLVFPDLQLSVSERHEASACREEKRRDENSHHISLNKCNTESSTQTSHQHRHIIHTDTSSTQTRHPHRHVINTDTSSTHSHQHTSSTQTRHQATVEERTVILDVEIRR